MTEGSRANPLITVMILCIVVAVFLGLFLTIWAIDVRFETLQADFRLASQERETHAEQARNDFRVLRAEIQRICGGDEEAEPETTPTPTTPTAAPTPTN